MLGVAPGPVVRELVVLVLAALRPAARELAEETAAQAAEPVEAEDDRARTVALGAAEVDSVVLAEAGPAEVGLPEVAAAGVEMLPTVVTLAAPIPVSEPFQPRQ